MKVGQQAARQLSYYETSYGVGVLAPRGWYCFGTYGSGGDTLLVSPQPIDSAKVFSSDWDISPGPVINVSYHFGGTSGRFFVADIIARVFPAYRKFVENVLKENITSSPHFGAYPTDTLTYKSKSVVEFKTPAGTVGLGTLAGVSKGDAPIRGAAILVGKTPDLILISARLPPSLAELAPVIIAQVESDAEHCPCH